MNAVISLCHFCELHGPSILFCTQPFHCLNHTHQEILKGAVATPSSCGINQNRLRSESFSEEPSKGDGEKLQVQRTSSGSRQTTCEACRSLETGEPGLVSIDSESHITYISMQYPEERELYRILRHACVRSLSCEVCPGREGPIMFGDETNGYVFSYTFFIKDLESRGFHRWYSLICVMMDKVYLVNSWQFLISNFKNIIDDLQSKADHVYKAEQNEKPQRDALLQPRKPFITPEQFHRGRGGQSYRSLVQITRDKTVFHFLHKQFTWILRSASQRYSEKLLEGPPLEDYLFDEDEQTNVNEKLQAMVLSPYPDSSEGPVFKSLHHMYKVLGDSKFHLAAFHVVRGDQVIVQAENKATIKSTLRMLKELIPAGCFRAMYYEEEFQYSWRCNFLGLSLNAELPIHILESQLFVLIKITKTEEGTNRRAEKSQSFLFLLTKPQMEIYSSFCENSFDDHHFEVVGSPVDKEPTYLKELMQTLRSDNVTNDMFDLLLITMKDHWMGKVKVMFKFSKSGVRTSEEKDRLLKVLQAKPEDEILLKHWMTSLSRSYRTHLLNINDRKSES